MADLNDFDDKLQDDDNKVDVSDDEKSVDNNDDSVVDENESMADDEDVDDMFDMEDEQPDEIAVDVEKTQTNTDMLGLGDSDVSDDEYDGYWESSSQAAVDQTWPARGLGRRRWHGAPRQSAQWRCRNSLGGTTCRWSDRARAHDGVYARGTSRQQCAGGRIALGVS